MSFINDKNFFELVKITNPEKIPFYDSKIHETIKEMYKKDENNEYINHPLQDWLKYIEESNHPDGQMQQKAIAMHPKLTDDIDDIYDKYRKSKEREEIENPKAEREEELEW